jgi:hypothetical protein
MSKHLSAFLKNRGQFSGINLSSVLHVTTVVETCLLTPSPVCLASQSTYIYSTEHRVQISVWRLPNYWHPTPSPPSECVLRPHQRQGGYTLAGWWGGGGGGSIFRKTPDIGLASYSIIPLHLACCPSPHPPHHRLNPSHPWVHKTVWAFFAVLTLCPFDWLMHCHLYTETVSGWRDKNFHSEGGDQQGTLTLRGGGWMLWRGNTPPTPPPPVNVCILGTNYSTGKYSIQVPARLPLDSLKEHCTVFYSETLYAIRNMPLVIQELKWRKKL